jgi:DNA-binding MarR family transcriptional regulator
MTGPDIRQAEKVALKLMQVHEHLEGSHAALFKTRGLSGPQYNVLRILRGARGEDLCCQDVGRRMLKRVPDVTRLLDRLEQRGLITRWRSEEDRRVVHTRITEEGLALLADIDGPLAEQIRQEFRAFDERKLKQLDRLLGALLSG